MNFEKLDVWKVALLILLEPLQRKLELNFIGLEVGYIGREVALNWIAESKELAAMLTSLKDRFNSEI